MWTRGLSPLLHINKRQFGHLLGFFPSPRRPPSAFTLSITVQPYRYPPPPPLTHPATIAASATTPAWQPLSQLHKTHCYQSLHLSAAHRLFAANQLLWLSPYLILPDLFDLRLFNNNKVREKSIQRILICNSSWRFSKSSWNL